MLVESLFHVRTAESYRHLQQQTPTWNLSFSFASNLRQIMWPSNSTLAYMMAYNRHFIEFADTTLDSNIFTSSVSLAYSFCSLADNSLDWCIFTPSGSLADVLGEFGRQYLRLVYFYSLDQFGGRFLKFGRHLPSTSLQIVNDVENKSPPNLAKGPPNPKMSAKLDIGLKYNCVDDRVRQTPKCLPN